MPSTALYTRISKDDQGDHLGVERQERLCRQLASERGLDVAVTLVDNDVSAYRRKPRPGFERLVELLKAGEVEAVCAYHVDRLYRRTADLERLVEIVEATGAQVHTVAAGNVDLSTASGRMVARMLGAAAQHESERIGERMRVKHDELAAAGRAPGGRAPFGYVWNATVGQDGAVRRSYAVAPLEAAAVRQMATRILEGASLLTVAKELDRAAISTREGFRWRHETVRKVLLHPAIAGLRVHRGEVAGPGDWPAIVDRATWEALRATLADPARKRTRPARRYLLSGLVTNPADEPMAGTPDRAGRPTYATRSTARPWVSVEATKLEAFVTEAVLVATDHVALPMPAEAPTAGADVVRLEEELDELAGLRGQGIISLSEWTRAREPLQARLAAARKAAGTRRQPTRTTALLTERGAVRRAWPHRDLAERREILAAVMERIVVSPASRGRWTPLEERVEVRWKA